MSAHRSPLGIHWETIREGLVKQGHSEKTIKSFKGMFYAGAAVSVYVRSQIIAMDDEEEAEEVVNAIIEDLASFTKEAGEEFERMKREEEASGDD